MSNLSKLCFYFFAQELLNKVLLNDRLFQKLKLLEYDKFNNLTTYF